MVKGLEDFKLTVLVALVLKDLLNGDSLTSFRDGCLENDTKRPVSNDFLSVVCKTLNFKLKSHFALTIGLEVWGFAYWTICCFCSSSCYGTYYVAWVTPAWWRPAPVAPLLE